MQQINDPLGDGKSKLELIDWMGGDLAVVSDARASFDRSTQQLFEDCDSDELSSKDIKLINYLIAHRHYSPLRGTVFKFKVRASLYTSRQWWKHVVASSHIDAQNGWNEKSFRYVTITSKDSFRIPQQFHIQAAFNKQSSGEPLAAELNRQALAKYLKTCDLCFEAYEDLIALGVSREEARGILPMAIYTTFVWTASLQSVLHFIDLRRGKGAQTEISLYAKAIEDLIKPLIPHTLKAWNRHCHVDLLPSLN